MGIFEVLYLLIVATALWLV